MRKWRLRTNALRGFENGDVVIKGSNGLHESCLIKANQGGVLVIEITLLKAMPEWFEEIKDDHHWQGMYPVKENETYISLDHELIDFNPRQFRNRTRIAVKYDRAYGVCAKSVEEMIFVHKQKQAYIELVDKIKELNHSWLPDWSDESEEKWEPSLMQPERCLDIVVSTGRQVLPDWFQGKTDDIWRQAFEQIGEENVKLALGWTKYEN